MNYTSYMTALFFSITFLTCYGSEEPSLDLLNYSNRDPEDIKALDLINDICSAHLIPHNKQMFIKLFNFKIKGINSFQPLDRNPIKYLLEQESATKLLLYSMGVPKSDELATSGLIEYYKTDITIESVIKKIITFTQYNTKPELPLHNISLRSVYSYSDQSSYTLHFAEDLKPVIVSFEEETHEAIAAYLQQCKSTQHINAILLMDIIFNIANTNESKEIHHEEPYRLFCKICKINDTTIDL